MNTRSVNSAAGVILAAMQQNRTPAGIALALESAGLLMSPEAAKDMASVSTDAVGVAERAVDELRREHGLSAALRAENDRLFLAWGSARMRSRRKNEALMELRARVAELEALKPAKYQTCRVCGAGYEYGWPCSTCAFKARMAAEAGTP